MSTGIIRNINTVPTSLVQMVGVNGAEMAIMVGREHGALTFALRHFRVIPGGNTARHSHDYEHQVFIVEGGGTVLLNGAEQPVRSGDVIYVPANQEHQFKADPAAGLRFLCLVPVTRDCGDPTPGS